MDFGLALDVCSAGVILFCKDTGKIAAVSVVERTNQTAASNYQGELLAGLIGVLLLYAASLDTSRTYKTARVRCDNIGMVGHGNNYTKPLLEKQSQIDVILAIRNILFMLPFPVEFHHVYGHGDEHTPFRDLPLINQLNVMADHLAKSAIHKSLHNLCFISTGSSPYMG